MAIRKLSKEQRNELSQHQTYYPPEGEQIPGFYSAPNPFMGGRNPIRASQPMAEEDYKSVDQIALENTLSGQRQAVKPAPPETQAVKTPPASKGSNRSKGKSMRKTK